jgi:hypothetical protein
MTTKFEMPDGTTYEVEDNEVDDKLLAEMQDLHDKHSGEAGFGTKVGGFVKGLAKGAVQGISGIPKAAAILGAADVNKARADVGLPPKAAKDSPIYKFGEWLDETVAPRIDARVRGDFMTQVGAGLGQVATSIATGVVAGGATKVGQLATAAVPAMGMQMSEDYGRAVEKGATEEEAVTAGMWGAAWGATDVLPFERAFSILQKASPGWKGFVKDVGGQFFLEGGQEGMQQVLSNATAKLTYDEQQSLMEDVLPSASVGGVVGALAGTILNVLGAKGKVKVGKDKTGSGTPGNETIPSASAGDESAAAKIIADLKAQGIGATATENTTVVVPASKKLEPTTVDSIQANMDGTFTPSQAFAKKLLEAGASESEVHAVLSLTNAHARYRGEDLDTFVEQRVADVRKGGKGELNQAEQGAFYSKAEQVVQQKMPNRMRLVEALNLLDKNGITADEQGTFIQDIWKDTTKAAEDIIVSKQEVLEAIKAASVQTEDVVLGGRTENIDEGILSGTSLPVTDAQFSSYQLPGAKEGSYREMFVTAPTVEQKFRKQSPAEALKFRNEGMITEDEYNSIVEKGGYQDDYGTRWQDGHSAYSSIQNPIVRIRFNERSVDGKRILFVEEMQGPYPAEQDKMPEYLRKRLYDIGTKRVLAYAKENGFDGVAWTTGEQQAERYDLSKQIESVEAKRYGKTGQFYIEVNDKNSNPVFTGDVAEDQIEQYVGKELAKKISEQDGGTFTGLDLKVGGEGLKDTYDKRIPSLMKKYGKGEVGQIAIDRTEKEWGDSPNRKMENVSYIPITDKTPSSFPLYQNVKGAVSFLEDGRAAISIMQKADASTILHEMSHIFRRSLLDEESVAANEWVGARSNEWTTEQEELWARSFERYLRRGKAPNAYLKEVFEKMRTWLRRIYKTLKGSPIDYPLDPKVVALFDKILTPAELPSQKKPFEMPFAAWQKVYGEDEAAMYGLTDKSVAVREPSRFSTLVNDVNNKAARGIFLGRYLTKAETEAQLAIVTAPEYLQQPLAAQDLDSYIIRVLNLFAVRANAAFHENSSIAPILEDLQIQRDNAEKKSLFDNDLGHAYMDETGGMIVTRRTEFDETIKFITKLDNIQKVKESWATPAREQLLKVKNDLFKGQQDVVMDRTTGNIYAVEQKSVYHASLVDVDRGTVRRVPISDLYAKFIWPEIISPDSGATLTKDEWMLERHYKEVRDAVDRGEVVPSFAIEPHLTKDPTLQDNFDSASAFEDNQDGTQAQSDAIVQLFQEAQDPSNLPNDDEKVVAGPTRRVDQSHLDKIAVIVQASYKELSRLSNVTDHEEGPRLLDMISKTELQRLARIQGAVGERPAEEYLADLYKELDEYKAALRDRSNELDAGTVGLIFDRSGTIYEGLKKFTDTIENIGQSRLLDEHPTISWTRNANHWLQRNILHKEPTVESSVTWAWNRAFFTMQGLSNRYPVAKPLFKLAVGMRNNSSKVQHDLMLGKSEIETIQIEKDGGVVELKLKAPGLRTLRSLGTNSPAYDALRSLIVVGDKLRSQFKVEEIISGMDARVEALVKGANEATDPAEQAMLVQEATAYEALNQILSRKSIEDRKLAAKAYFEIQDTLQYSYFKTRQVMENILGKQAGEKVMSHIYPQGYIPGYFPHMRFGKYGVVVKDAENKTKYFTAFEDWVSQKNALAELKAKYPNDRVAVVDTTNRLDLKLGGGEDMMTAIQDVIMKTQLNQTIEDPATLEAVQKALIETTTEMVKAHGIFSMFKERQDVPGYDERITRVMFNRVQDFASAIAKIEFAQKGAKELATLRHNPRLYNYSSEWFGAMLEGADSSDAMMSKIRAAIFLKHLGFNIKTAFVVFMDKLTNAPSVLGKYTTQADKKIIAGLGDTMRFMSWLHKVEKVMNSTGVSRDVAVKQLGLAEGFDEETTNALLWSMDSGATLAKFMPEVMNNETMTWEAERGGESAVGRGLYVAGFGMRKVFDASAWMVSKMEELNKMSTFLSAYRVMRKEKEYSFDRSVDVAQDIVNDAHVVYGRSNIPLPFLRKGIWKYSRMAYIFRAFEHNYLQLLFNMSTVEGTRGKMMALRSLATLAALAGVPALPFFTMLFKLWGVLTGDDPEQWFRRTFNSMTGNTWTSALFSDGLPAVAHTSIRGSLQVGAYSDWMDMAFGVAGSTIRDVGKIGTSAKSGDWDGFVKTIMPSVFSNLYKAHQGATTGVMSGKGTPLREDTIGAQIKYSGYDSLLKVTGFNVQRELNSYRMKDAAQREDSYWADRRSSIYVKFAKGARLEDKAYIQSALEDAIQYERDRRGKRALDIPPISREGLKRSLSESGLQRKQVLQVLRLSGRLP